jgi:hypothetical protein
MKYYADRADGTTIEIEPFDYALRYDRGTKIRTGKHHKTGEEVIIRAVDYKRNPSRHNCDNRCMNAAGRFMNCECSCGGVNHGKRA